ncbi:MAG: hypothetical protein OXN79_05205, partial [bacterium]|nr:hypothetical protein [bacterium]
MLRSLIIAALLATLLAAAPAVAQNDPPPVTCRAGEQCSPSEISVEVGDEFTVTLTGGRGWAPVQWGGTTYDAVIYNKSGLTGSGYGGGWACIGFTVGSDSCGSRVRLVFVARANGTADISIWGVDALTVTVGTPEPEPDTRPKVWISHGNPIDPDDRKQVWEIGESGAQGIRFALGGPESAADIHYRVTQAGDCLAEGTQMQGKRRAVGAPLAASVGLAVVDDSFDEDDCVVTVTLDHRDRYRIDPDRASVTVTVVDDDPSFTLRHGDETVASIEMDVGEHYDYTIRVNRVPTKTSPDRHLTVNAHGDIRIHCGGGGTCTDPTGTGDGRQLNLTFDRGATQWYLCRSNIFDGDGNLPDPVWRASGTDWGRDPRTNLIVRGCDGRQVYVGNGAWEKREWFIEWETRYYYSPINVRVTRNKDSASGSASVTHSNAPTIAVTLTEPPPPPPPP